MRNGKLQLFFVEKASIGNTSNDFCGIFVGNFQQGGTIDTSGKGNNDLFIDKIVF